MNSSRRWLVIFAIAIGVLVLATVSLVLFTKNSQVTLLSADTPQGTVQRYLIALQEKDYQKAYSYLSFDSSLKMPYMSYNDWLSSVSAMPGTYNQTAWKATLGKVTLDGDNATVEVTIDTFRAGGLFSNSQNSQIIPFQLSRTAGVWFITSPNYVYWIY